MDSRLRGLVSLHEEARCWYENFSWLRWRCSFHWRRARRRAAMRSSRLSATSSSTRPASRATDLTPCEPGARTTPRDDSILDCRAGAFRPQTDREVLVDHTAAATSPPITTAVPGLQISGWFASDPTHEARFLLRLPDNWNGKLVVAGTSSHAQRVQRRLCVERLRAAEGLRVRVAEQGRVRSNFVAAPRLRPRPDRSAGVPVQPDVVLDSLASLLRRRSGQAVHAMGAVHDRRPRKLARTGVEGALRQRPRVHLRGRHVERRLPGAARGGAGAAISSTAAWIGKGRTSTADAPNILTDLPPAVLNYPDYAHPASSANSTAAKNIQLAGYPPDIVGAATDASGGCTTRTTGKLTACQWQKRLDPTYDTYGSRRSATTTTSRGCRSRTSAQRSSTRSRPPA